MRLIPLLLVLSAVLNATAAPAQGEYDREYDREYLEARLAKFKGMRTTGFVIAGIGAGALLGGIILASNGEWETQQTATGTQTNAQDGAAVGGLLLIVAGVPATIAGVILGSIGSSKVQKYQAILQNVSVDLRPGHTGARLSYKF